MTENLAGAFDTRRLALAAEAAIAVAERYEAYFDRAVVLYADDKILARLDKWAAAKGASRSYIVTEIVEAFCQGCPE